MSDAALPPGRRIALLVNPAAGRHDPAMLDRLADRLVRRGFATEMVVGRGCGDLARRLGEIEADVVAVSGGDGTVHEVVGALVARAGRPPLLAVIPNGTANVLAHEYRLPRRSEAIVAAIAAGRTRPLHLGVATMDGGSPQPFFLMTSAGYDAEVVAAVEAGPRRRVKKLAFVVEAVRHAARRRPRLRLDLETLSGERRVVDCAAAVVTKARHYGGPFVLADGVATERPGLKLVMLAADRPAALLAAAFHMAVGRLERAPGVTVVDVARVRLATAEADGVAVQIDGEPHGFTPIEVSPYDRALELIVAAEG